VIDGLSDAVSSRLTSKLEDSAFAAPVSTWLLPPQDFTAHKASALFADPGHEVCQSVRHLYLDMPRSSPSAMVL